MQDMSIDTQRLLKQTFGYDGFREGQEALIDGLLCGRDVMGVLPTGGGKSLCYQLPALALPGMTLVVSPLIALMEDQLRSLEGAGALGAYLNSAMSTDQQRIVMDRALAGGCKLVYTAPERLNSPEFLHFASMAKIDVLAVDEAHCISQWGHDFRPSYRKIGDFLSALPRRPAVGAFTATATPRVRRDIVASLGLENPVVVTASFDRPNLYFSTWQGEQKYRALTDFLRQRQGKSGIVYCATRKIVEELSFQLCRDGYAATRYHAGLSNTERSHNQAAFYSDHRYIMVATNAFGMGVDKANVSYVVHYNMPQSLENYYQEAGRAGRDGWRGDCLLLFHQQDVALAQWMLAHGPVGGEQSKEDQRSFKAKAVERQKRMIHYATSGHCLRNQILRYFGEHPMGRCGFCGNCKGEDSPHGCLP